MDLFQMGTSPVLPEDLKISLCANNQRDLVEWKTMVPLLRVKFSEAVYPLISNSKSKSGQEFTMWQQLAG